jgi:hypothetical protein
MDEYLVGRGFPRGIKQNKYFFRQIHTSLGVRAFLNCEIDSNEGSMYNEGGWRVWISGHENMEQHAA